MLSVPLVARKVSFSSQFFQKGLYHRTPSSVGLYSTHLHYPAPTGGGGAKLGGRGSRWPGQGRWGGAGATPQLIYQIMTVDALAL